MRAFIQRVAKASVSVEGTVTGEIGRGLLVLLGVKYDDTEACAKQLAKKILELRIFNDEGGKLNRNVTDVGGDVLVVSQFTLYGDTRKGNRPSFSEAAKGEIAEPLYRLFVKYCREGDIEVRTGVFGAEMLVSLVNDGPVSFMCEAET